METLLIAFSGVFAVAVVARKIFLGLRPAWQPRVGSLNTTGAAQSVGAAQSFGAVDGASSVARTEGSTGCGSGCGGCGSG
jgi:hypothetical protein